MPLTSRLAVVFCVGAGLAACNPVGCCAPADLPKDAPLVLASSSAGAPKENVDVVYDSLGVPHIFGQSEADLAYGLGWMHGRDRQFQVFAYVHAGEGRLTELLGADLLEIDRQNRLLTFRLDEQLAALSDRDRALIDAYADGINDGAAHTGRSAEMAVLGVEWEPLDARDVLSVMRLQQWDQSVGFGEEMGRFRLAKALGGTDDPRYRELTADTPSGAHPIVSAEEHSGAPFSAATATASKRKTKTAQQQKRSASASWPKADPRKRDLVEGVLKDVKLDLGARFGRGGFGASNEWVVDGAHNSSGVPVLCNDPHLGHSAPGVFYMVHLEGPDFTIAGGSFPGIPGVLIGHGRHIAWGITNAFADVQDVLVLRPSSGDDNLYELDGNPMSFTRTQQQFRLGKGKGAVVLQEDYLESVFGPVLPAGYGSYNGAESWVSDDERLVLQWTAFAFPKESASLISSFWSLAESNTIEQAHAALQTFTAPSMSVAIAIGENDDGPAGIHYRLGGIIPVRGDVDGPSSAGGKRVDFPRLATTRSAGFQGILPAEEKPQLDNPPSGFLVAANQRVVDNDVLSQRFVGFEGAKPFRAMRIHERLADLLKDGGTPDPEALLSIQQDVESIEARVLAPILGKHCPDSIDGFPDDVVADFCAAVADFDGVYSKDATAIPFARLYRSVTEAILLQHLDHDLAFEALDQTYVQMSLFDLIQRADAGEDVATFDLDDVVARGAEDALWLVQQETGTWESDWRWAKLHQLQFRGLLASAPVIGAFFQTGSHEESGTSSAPRAENSSFSHNLRVEFGAGLRNFAVMGDEPVVKMTNDIGNSGAFGHRHLEDQYPLWTAGTPYVIRRDRDDAVGENDGLLQLTPKD